jgi:hypothetical protein
VAHELGGDHRDVVPLADDLGAPELRGWDLTGQLALEVEQPLVLEVEDRIGIADRGPQQRVRVDRRRRHRDLEARHIEEPVLDRLGMLRAEPRPGPVGHADRDRHADLPAGHVAVLGQLVGDLVEADAGEVGEHDLGQRAQPLDRGADRRADDRLLGDRRVEHPPCAEALVEAVGGLERTAGGADVLADDEDVLVGLELVCHRAGDGLLVGDRHA